MEEKRYLCIDLKSFFASCECVDRGLDPFKVNLVVADPERTDATVCLAISPAMKALGIRNRCRLFEIPKNVEFIIARPRMRLYMEKSAEIYSIYLRYISPDDIHVYSIDECFIDITDYMKLYGMTDREMAALLTGEVFKQTGIRATVGIGTNLFLTKVALDVTAKHAKDFTGYLDEKTFKETMWHHTPITDVWNIGAGIAKRLAKYGIYDLYGVAHFDEKILYKEFGVNAELLIDHANGIEPCTIKDIREYRSKTESLSTSQILFRDYNYKEAWIVIKEMLDGLVLQIVDKKLVTDNITLVINYSGKDRNGVGSTEKIPEFTSSFRKLCGYFKTLYEKIVDSKRPIKRVTVGLNDLMDKKYRTYDFLTDYKREDKEHDLSEAVIDIKRKFGKNAILKGTSFEQGATGRDRNKMIGGHRSGEDAD